MLPSSLRPSSSFCAKISRKITSPLWASLHLELTYINSAARKSLWQLVKLLLDMGTSLQIILYRGTEDEELEDYEELVRVWERESRLRIEEREGYYELK